MDNPKRKIHIVASCTSRKRLNPNIRLGDVSNLEPAERVIQWWNCLTDGNYGSSSTLASKSSKIAAADLYVGSYWSSIRSLPDLARTVGFEPYLWVVSAGYGLIPSNLEITPYSATFVKGDRDSIYLPFGANNYRKFAKEWWRRLSKCRIDGSKSPRTISELFNENSGDFFLFSLSEDYLEAIEDDVICGLNSLENEKDLLIITSRTYRNRALQSYVVPSDARLQCHPTCSSDCRDHLLGRGIRGSIGAQLSEYLIRSFADFEMDATKMRSFVNSTILDSPSLIGFDRKRMDESEIVTFIRAELYKNPASSCSALLRQLRAGGQACEQKRFGKLFQMVKDSI